MEVNSLFAHQKLLGWMENMSSLEKVKHSYINKDEKITIKFARGWILLEQLKVPRLTDVIDR